MINDVEVFGAENDECHREKGLVPVVAHLDISLFLGKMVIYSVDGSINSMHACMPGYIYIIFHQFRFKLTIYLGLYIIL